MRVESKMGNSGRAAGGVSGAVSRQAGKSGLVCDGAAMGGRSQQTGQRW